VRTHVEYFAVPASLPDADVLKLCDLPVPFPGTANEYRPTILIDLHQPEEDLWNCVTPPTRKMIRQATRLGIVVDDVSALDEKTWSSFQAAYFKLWQRKSKAGALGVGQIRDLIASGRFVLTRSRDAQGTPLSWHSYVKTGGRARLQTTISDMDPSRGSDWNNLVGRAHRLHHWLDMLHFKSQGVGVYDFGGVYRGSDDPEQINIARFKQLFGGHFADTYDAVVPLTWKGRAALSIVSHISPARRAGGLQAGVPA
jgi:hypothetical protein